MTHNKKITKRSAFNLIEMVVAVTIIAIIVSGAAVSVSSFRQKSRDAQRLQAIKQIQTALELYRGQENSYPAAITFGQPLMGSTSSTTYMNPVPNNPTVTNTTNCPSSNYSYTLDSGGKYKIQICLERGDTVRNAGRYCVTPEGFVPGYCLDVPLTIANLALWLDASDTDTLFTSDTCTGAAPANNGALGCWKDKSGNGYNATQSNNTYKPKWKSSVSQINNKSAVYFFSTYMTFGDVLDIGYSDRTYCFVYNLDTLKSTVFFAKSSWNVLSNEWFLRKEYADDLVGIYAGLQPATTANTTNYGLFCDVINRTTRKERLYYNGQLLNTYSGFPGVATDFSNTYPLFMAKFDAIHNSYDMYGNMVEAIFYNTAISDTERTDLENYFDAKYILY